MHYDYVLCAATIVKYGGKGLNIYIYKYIYMPLSVSTNIFLMVFKDFTQTDNKERNIQLSVADIFKRFSSFMLHLLLQYTVTFLSILYTSGIFIVFNGRFGILC